MKIYQLALVSLFVIFNFSTYSHSTVTDHNGDEFETQTSGGTMLNLPVFVNFDGSISYGIGIMDHSSHTTMDHGNMDHGNMDHGNMDHGNMDHGNMNETDDMNHDMTDNNHHHKKVDTIMWHIMPMIHIGGDYNKRIIALQEEAQPTDLLMPANFNGKHLSVINKRLELGAGLMLMGMPTAIDWGGFFQIGFMPYKGSSYFSKSHHINHERAKNALALKIPTSLEQLGKLKTSDKIITTTHGGIMMGAGLGATIFTDLSANYMTQGSWRIEIEKINSTKLRVTLTELELKHIMYNLGATIISTNFGKHRINSIRLDYEFDLSKEEALTAYLDTLQGDLQFADSLLTQDIDGITDLTRSTSNNTGIMRQTKIGLPLLFNRNTMKMTSLTKSKVTTLSNNTTVESEMEMLHNEINTDGVLSQHKKEFIMYMGSKNKVSDFNYKTSSFVWHYERDQATLNKLNRVLKRWNKSLNIRALKTFKAYRNKLGHTRATMNLVLAQSGLLKLEKMSHNNKKSFTKKLLKDNQLFSKFMNSLAKEDYKVTLKIQTEYFKSALLNY